MAVNVLSNPLAQTISSRDSFDYEGLPPELAAEAQAVNRRQQMANFLMQQGMQLPQGQMVGRFYVAPSPVQGLANMAQIGVGAYGNYKADEARKDISHRSSEMLAKAMQQYKGASDPVPLEGPRPTAQVMPPPQPGYGLAPQPPRQAMTQELPGPGAPVMTPRSPEERRQAIVDSLLLNRHPQAQAIGKLLLGELDTAEQRGLDRDVRREALATNAELRKGQIESNMLNTQALIDSRERQGQDANALKAELAKQQADLQKTLHGMDIAGRKDVATIMAESRKDVAGMKSGKGAALSATAQKELIQTDEQVQGGLAATKALDEALSINNDAMGFTGAGTAASIASVLPEGIRPKAVDATVNLDNIVMGSALPQLKEIFGGMPTEGERKVLLDMQGSSSKTPTQREAIFKRAKEAVQRRIEFNKQKAEQIRKGTYFSEQGGIPTEFSDAPLAPAPSSMTPTVPAFHDPEKQKRYEEFKKNHKP